MVSSRYRANRSIGQKLNALSSAVTQQDKNAASRVLANAINKAALADDAVTSDAILAEAVTEREIARAAVGTEHLGIVNNVTSDGDMIFSVPPGANLYIDDGTPLQELAVVDPTVGSRLSALELVNTNHVGTITFNDTTAVSLGAAGTVLATSGMTVGSDLVTYQRRAGWVHVRGHVARAAQTGPMFTLPAGYRPQYVEWVTGASSGTPYAEVKILTDGTVNVNSNITSGAFVFQISFPAFA